MGKIELEEAMVEFVEGRVDVLVCTTIIESGLDIPNANTIFIEDADRFGLAELHQLRGRVGRYRHRAYAHLLLPGSRPISPIATRRLKAIEEYSQLGAGFKIALRDLEIRGAGNILGAEQSGHIQLVGYQMYCELLAEAVRRLKNEAVEPPPRVAIDLGFAVSIPKAYINSDRQRMDVYRRIGHASNAAGLEQIAAELKDVYGPIPDEVDLLLQMAQIRLAAGPFAVTSITTSGPHEGGGALVVVFRETPGDKANRLFAKVKGTVRIPDPKTVLLELAPSYFEPKTLLMVLRKMFRSEGHL
jgi:transcription-repair coupling factor (superfamily II helicase)